MVPVSSVSWGVPPATVTDSEKVTWIEMVSPTVYEPLVFGEVTSVTVGPVESSV